MWTVVKQWIFSEYRSLISTVHATDTMSPAILGIVGVALARLVLGLRSLRTLVPFLGIVDFPAIHRHGLGSSDAQPDLVAADVHNDDLDLVTDHDRLIAFT